MRRNLRSHDFAGLSQDQPVVRLDEWVAPQVGAPDHECPFRRTRRLKGFFRHRDDAAPKALPVSVEGEVWHVRPDQADLETGQAGGIAQRPVGHYGGHIGKVRRRILGKLLQRPLPGGPLQGDAQHPASFSTSPSSPIQAVWRGAHEIDVVSPRPVPRPPDLHILLPAGGHGHGTLPHRHGVEDMERALLAFPELRRPDGLQDPRRQARGRLELIAGSFFFTRWPGGDNKGASLHGTPGGKAEQAGLEIERERLHGQVGMEIAGRAETDVLAIPHGVDPHGYIFPTFHPSGEDSVTRWV